MRRRFSSISVTTIDNAQNAQSSPRFWIKGIVATAIVSRPTLSVDRLLRAKPEREETRTIFSREELREINRHRESLAQRVDQLERLLRSELIKASDEEENDVIYWTEEYYDHVT